jgi:hypothetical protein
VPDPASDLIEDVIPLASLSLDAQSNRKLLQCCLTRAVAATACTRNPSLAMQGNNHLRALVQTALARACLQFRDPALCTAVHVRRALQLVFTLQCLVPRPAVLWERPDIHEFLTEGQGHVVIPNCNLGLVPTSLQQERAKAVAAAARQGTDATKLERLLERKVQYGTELLPCGSVRLPDGAVRFPSGSVLQANGQLKVACLTEKGIPSQTEHTIRRPLWTLVCLPFLDLCRIETL